MSAWTDWRDDFTAWAVEHPKKTAVAVAVGFALGALASWVF